ncbi:murein DD-endopeptidase MepM/ murein hydrolase activator NlpD [Pseudoclavibacter sp. JAI123]|uniref:M23 family metallopeptidase n=1 Tax=Pseudoclavibacter sp. JAI123 TaxID=2723065 RepID=UPI0015CE9329|nr:M23 family metallopeptidase [Pseudoclavibacter sp. JAI123]NYF11789.1 murein DD-endopeptidase MepM/ murein hydrolase activator NlpD [Pseudoclavibacter sp. JAI123]
MSARTGAWWGIAIVILLAPALLLGALVLTTIASTSLASAAACATSGFSVPVVPLGTETETGTVGSGAAAGAIQADPISASRLTVSTTIDGEPAEFAGAQLSNAAHILTAGREAGLGVRDQVIGVMTAIGESTLQVLDHGDAAGPDSRGLFQQRDNGAWGSYADRMDPHASAGSFFNALLAVAERDALAPSEAAHRVQGNADPQHYAKYWQAAIAVSETISGTSTGLGTGMPPASGASPDAGGGCGAASAAAAAAGGSTANLSPSGWAAPGDGGLTDTFGNRFHPTDFEWRMHNGIDLAAGGCGGQIWAAQSGTVVEAEPDSSGNGTIRVDHGGGLVTKYLHMESDGYLVGVGAVVTAGQQIGITGTSGQSTGCHLHFEVLVDGERVDPLPFLDARGVSF